MVDNTGQRGNLAVYQGNSAVHPTPNTVLAALRPGAQQRTCFVGASIPQMC